ncbi:MAG TPA: phosphoribosylglycinamide formyltransferase [Firmicutes bacterium]|jgi:phosphoribosylglycinamide formyltransferase-1|nr:phosphoribosylglycinamide formyltransferase [Bacillota bacterium]
MLRLGVLASGRGSNLQALIDAIEAGSLAARLSIVISDNPHAQALERARRHGAQAVVIALEGERAAFEDRLVAALFAAGVDLVVLAGFMRLLGKRFLSRLPCPVMNIHPSLLPAFRGLRAQQQALDYGVKVAGCTVHFVDEGMDTGPIILQKAVPVKENDTEADLAARILAEEHQLLPAAVRLFAEGRLRLEGRKVRILPEKQ